MNFCQLFFIFLLNFSPMLSNSSYTQKTVAEWGVGASEASDLAERNPPTLRVDGRKALEITAQAAS